MKRSELRKIIREEILKEAGNDKYMNGVLRPNLVYTNKDKINKNMDKISKNKYKPIKFFETSRSKFPEAEWMLSDSTSNTYKTAEVKEFIVYLNKVFNQLNLPLLAKKSGSKTLIVADENHPNIYKKGSKVSIFVEDPSKTDGTGKWEKGILIGKKSDDFLVKLDSGKTIGVSYKELSS